MSGRVGVDDLIATTGAGAAELGDLDRVEVWPVLAEEAYHGPAGRFVRAVAPYSEADNVALLVHFLVAYGNVVGPGPHVRVAADRHPARLNAVFVGQTSLGRKGSAWGPVRAVLERADATWAAARIKGGLSSGEGLIYHVRDAREESQPIKERGRVVDYQRVVVDAGEADKRLLVIETEFAAPIRRSNGEGNTLSAVIRQAWDSGNLATLTKHQPLTATDAHVSIVGHITPEELQAELRAVEAANGFANRILFHVVRRSKFLPDGEAIPVALLDDLSAQFGRLAATARGIGEMRRDAEATATWRAVYEALSSNGLGGLAGAVVSRGTAQVLRLSITYALLDGSGEIREPHLSAALAVWQHAEASARRVFGDLLGLPLADRVLALLRDKGPLPTEQIHRALAGHAQAESLRAALETLEGKGLVRRRRVETKGRPAVVWEATPR